MVLNVQYLFDCRDPFGKLGLFALDLFLLFSKLLLLELQLE